MAESKIQELHKFIKELVAKYNEDKRYYDYKKITIHNVYKLYGIGSSTAYNIGLNLYKPSQRSLDALEQISKATVEKIHELRKQERKISCN